MVNQLNESHVSEPVTILLIDDSASVRAVLRATLEFEGYAVLEAANGSRRSRESSGSVNP